MYNMDRKSWIKREPGYFKNLLPKYDLGQIIHAGKHPKVNEIAFSRFERKGWSGSESDFTWSDSEIAYFIINIDHIPADAITLRLHCGAFVDSVKLPKQKFIISVNGQQLYEFEQTTPDVRRLDVNIPKEVLSNKLHVSIICPSRRSPQELNLGNDSRKLGIRLHSVSLVPMHYPTK